MSAESRDQVFRFRYTLFPVEARIDDTRLEVRSGVKTQVAPIARMQHLFVHHDRSRHTVELVVSYAVAGGRLRRLRVFADDHEPAFDAFVDALLARRPEIDIRHVERDEAYRRMGSARREAVVLPGLMAVALAGMALMFAPMLIHGFDRGEARVTVAALAAGERPTTRNLVVEGRALVDRLITAAPEADPPPTEVTAWLPLVAPDWDGASPVAVVLEVRGRPIETITALGARGEFQGVLRDVWWEGLDDRRRRAFGAVGVLVAPDVAVIDYGAHGRDDLALAGGVLGLMLVMLVGVVVSLRRQRGPSGPAGPRPRLNRPQTMGDEVDAEWD